MKEVLERICTKQIVFASLSILDPKLFGTRKKLFIFSGVDLKSFYHLIFRLEQKSRFVLKQTEEILALALAVESQQEHNYCFKHLILKAPLCSKAAALLHKQGWKVYNDTL